MIVHKCEQGTQEWFEARAGVITASMFSEVRRRLKTGPNAGDFSEAAKEYAFKLAVERIGKTLLDEDGYKSWQAERGNLLEEEARIRHEADIGQFVTLAGFVTTDCGRFGCSADAFVSEEGGGEYKCFLAPKKLRPIIVDNDWGAVTDQVQGCIWITERRQWWDQCLYAPILSPIGLDFKRQRAERDDEYIRDLINDLLVFDDLVEEYKAEIEKAAGKPGEIKEQPADEPEPEYEFQF